MAVLNDAADYFAALRDALLEAHELVYIIGWDIHSETRLVGASGRADDGLPVTSDEDGSRVRTAHNTKGNALSELVSANALGNDTLDGFLHLFIKATLEVLHAQCT